MGWTRHEECMEEINTYTIFNQETLLKDNIKMGQKKWCMRMWTELNWLGMGYSDHSGEPFISMEGGEF